MKTILFLALSLTVSSCAYVFDLRYPLTEPPTTVTVIDQRPNEDKVDTVLDQCFAGVIGDRHFTPDRVGILRQRVSNEVSSKLKGKTVLVKQLRSINLETRISNLQAMVLKCGSVSPKDFGIADGTQFPSWVICEIIIEVDGRLIRGRGIDGYGGLLIDRPAHHLNALMRAIDQIIASV